MFRSSHWLILAVLSLSVCVCAADQNNKTDANTTCNFDPNRQLAVDYQKVEVGHGKKGSGEAVSFGKVWAPGGKPLTLFANTPISVGGTNIPDGAYTMFLIPQEEKPWTLIISRSTDTSGMYDHSKDLARVPMEFGVLSQTEPEFVAYFAHVAPNQCNLRLDLRKTRAWVDFRR